MSSKHFKIAKIEKLPDWEVEVRGQIELEFLNECRKDAIKHLKEHASLPGFRPGQVPEEVLVKSVGEMRVLEETAEVALGKEYGSIMEEAKLRPISRPHISITKLAPGIPLEFTMKVALEPEFELPDYKKIAQEVTEIEDKEKRRLKILENLNKETKLEIPSKFVEAETHHMLHHFKHDVEKAGMKWEEYLEKIKKTEKEVEDGWKEQVVSRAKSELILAKIAKEEGVKTYQEVFELLEKKG